MNLTDTNVIPNIITICGKHLKNKCKNKKCTSIHLKLNKEDLILDDYFYENDIDVCTFNTLHFCRNKNCKNLHCRKNRALICKTYEENKTCNKNNCNRLHYSIEEIYNNLSNKYYNYLKNNPDFIEVCLDYNRGICNNKCKFYHLKYYDDYNKLSSDEFKNFKSYKICKYNLTGFCELDNDCLYYHSKPNIANECHDYLKYGKCKKINCKRIHKKFSDTLCSFYNNNTICKQGDKCKFRHNLLNEDNNELSKKDNNVLSKKDNNVLPIKDNNLLPIEDNNRLYKKDNNLLPDNSIIPIKDYYNLTYSYYLTYLSNYNYSYHYDLNYLGNLGNNDFNYSDNHSNLKIYNTYFDSLLIKPVKFQVKNTFLHFEEKKNNKKRNLSCPPNFIYT